MTKLNSWQYLIKEKDLKGYFSKKKTKKQFDTSTTDEMYLGQRFEILQCLIVICEIPRLPKDKLRKQTIFSARIKQFKDILEK